MITTFLEMVAFAIGAHLTWMFVECLICGIDAAWRCKDDA